MYAIIVTGGKQYKVEEGKAIFVEKLDAKQGDKVTFDKVILVSGDDTKIGTPFVDGAAVEGTVEKQGKEKKVVTFTLYVRFESANHRLCDYRSC